MVSNRSMRLQQATLGIIAALLLSGCGLVTGEKITFGQSFPYEHYRGRTYYITSDDDAALIRKLKIKIQQEGVVGNAVTPPQYELHLIISKYKDGALGWF